MRKVIVIGLLAASALVACAPAAGNTAELQSQVTALQTQVAALESEHTAASAFEVAVAQYVMDAAGFHAMAEALAETQTIDPAYGGAVAQVKTILAATTWPEELREQATDFAALLDEYSAKIDADDGAGAVALSEQVHEAQHDFSHAIGEWLDTAAEHGHED
ncbi:MAG: hypothetical protein IT317_03405 [Anaerolineales bacterium]|nr:hypothetical protein [Anaerolineales bacterium]